MPFLNAVPQRLRRMHLTGDELRDAAGDAPAIVAEIVDTIDGDGLMFITA